MDTNTTPTGKSLISKLAAVMKEIGRIPKNGHNDHFDYSFVKEADLVEAIRDKLAAKNVVVVPSKKRTEVVELAKVLKNGEVVTAKVGLLHITYTFLDGDSGETLEAESVGEIEQDGGKGIYKAATGAKKYMLLESFLVATGDDPEQDQAKQSVPKKVETQAPRAQPRQAAITPATAQQLGYIEKLARQKGLFDPAKPFAAFGLQAAPTKAQAMKIIDELKAAKPRPQAAQVKAA